MWNSLTKYHPRIGFTFMPSVRSRIPCETGGYLVRTNAAGFRSDCEFVKNRAPGKFRAILFGDSQTAGNGNANADRYSDVLESIVPRLEIFNYALPNTGTDQHYLTYMNCANVDHDLVIIGIHVQNIHRVAHRFLLWRDPRGNDVVYAKPYFTIESGELVLHHVPVPKTQMTKDSISTDDAPHVYWGMPLAGLRNVVKKLGMRDLLQRIGRFQPVPDFSSADNPMWMLLRKILESWIRGSNAPVLLLLVPMRSFVDETSDPTGCQARLRELAQDTGCFLHDPLPDLWKYSKDDRRRFRFNSDSHLSPLGHRAMAVSLAPAIESVMKACNGSNEGRHLAS